MDFGQSLLKIRKKIDIIDINWRWRKLAFDFKKEYKEFYLPKNKPEIVTVPKANYITY